MAEIMARENMEQWGHSSIVEQETVRTIIKGFAEGRIKLPSVKAVTKNGGGALRVAPHFAVASGVQPNSARAELGYTAGTLGEFLGWKPTSATAPPIGAQPLPHGGWGQAPCLR
jgi:hypothetical protein